MSENTEYAQGRWSLKDLLASRDKAVIDSALEDLESATAALEAMREGLSPDMSGEAFMDALQALEEYSSRASVLSAYGGLWFSEDTQDREALAFMGRMEQLLTEANNRILFFNLWWIGLEERDADRLARDTGGLKYHLYKLRLFRRHTLSEPEEKVIAIKDINGTNALNNVYDMITNRFTFDLEVEGQTKHLNRDELMAYAKDGSAETREAAYRELYRVYGDESTVLAQIYTHIVRDWAGENLNLRKFDSPISARNLSNDIPDAVVDALLDVCSEQAGVFHRYFRLKARWLGMEKIRRFDLYAPLDTKSEKKIPYAAAVRMVLESFERFSPRMHELARRVLDDNRIDSELRPGKRGGAFCCGVLPQMTPWVLVNYTGEPRQVATLAHELGHAVHSMMASGHSVLTFHPALPLAETASVFSEMLLTDRLMREEDDPEVRRGLLAGVLDDIYATVMRQAFFVIFERDAHRAAAEGGNIDDLDRLYLENLRSQFGDSVDVDGIFRHEWTSIPHIYHAPFYCYAYSFGLLLSLSIYRQYTEAGESFKPGLFKILSHGGAESPSQILDEAGVDIADHDFWRGGFRIIEGMIEELEKGFDTNIS
jgi:oligoendopeptidase F